MILKQGRACLNFKGYFLFNSEDMVVLGWKIIQYLRIISLLYGRVT